MNVFDDVVRDIDGVIISGAKVYVYGPNGALAPLLDSDGVTPKVNPLTSDDLGQVKAWIATDGFYAIEYFWGGRKRYVRSDVLFGRTPIEEAEAAAASAEAASGPTYGSTSAGLAATTNGQGFAVDNGDGTVTVYLNSAGTAVAQRNLATVAYSEARYTKSADLASTASGKGGALVSFLQSGTGAAVRTTLDKLRDTVNAKDFGVVGDGVADDSADLNEARTKIDASRQTLHFTYGTFKVPSLGDMLAGEAWEGESPGFNYGVGTTATNINLAGSPMDTAGHPYVSLKNLTLDGGGTTTHGFVGGFVSQLTSVNITGCTVAGLHLPNGGYPVQTSAYFQSTFNGNYDGVLCENSTPGTQYFTECLFRQNTRYGFNGALPASYIGQSIFESNAGSGLYLTGNCGGLMLDTCYFEQNDIANGANGYQARINCTGDGWVTFNANQFGSTGITKVAKIDGGRVIFRGCTQVGDTGAVQLLVSETAEVIVENSFYGYCLPANVKIPARVPVLHNASIVLGDGGDSVDATAFGAAFGTGNFSISVVVECDDSASNARTLFSGDVGCFLLGLTGSTTGTQNIVFGPYGSAYVGVVFADIPIRCPTHIGYVRTSNVGKLYLNGRVIWSGADTSNYSGVTKYIGGVDGARGKIYAAGWHTSALTSQQVFDAWRCGGNLNAAGVAATFCLGFEQRSDGKAWVCGASSKGWATFTGSAAWASLSGPRRTPYTVSGLPTGYLGAMALVTDATATAFWSIVAGGGANTVPVTHDGTNWRIG